MYENHERAQAMLNAGASDYKSKGCAPSELISAIAPFASENAAACKWCCFPLFKK